MGWSDTDCGFLSFSYAFSGLRKRSPVPPAISGEADPMDRDGQNRGDGGGRGRGGSGGGGRRPPPYQPSSQQMVAQPQSSLESGRHSLVVAKGSSVEQGIGGMCASSSTSLCVSVFLSSSTSLS